MSGLSLNYGPEDFIEEDLKRLKAWGSLRSDIHNQYQITCGLLVTTNQFPPPSNFCGGLITYKKHVKGEFYFFKERVAITNPFMTPAEGARLIFAIVPQLNRFIPILVYAASEEARMYSINGKKLPLKKPGLGKIVNEKLRRIA